MREETMEPGTNAINGMHIHPLIGERLGACRVMTQRADDATPCGTRRADGDTGDAIGESNIHGF